MLLDHNEIIPNRLWVGRYVRAEDVKQLKLLDITTVLNLQSDEDLAVYGISSKRILRAYQEVGIELRRIAVQDFDREALARSLPECVAELEKALARPWARVYLHCTAGINRAPTTAAAYLIRSRGWSPYEAYEYVVGRRHCQPYLHLLEQYAESLKTIPQ